jgi:hypothetical protein
LLLGSLSLPARAAELPFEQPFAFTYTTDIEEEGEGELEQWLGWKQGHGHNGSRAFQSRTELEYGITDDLQGALYLNYDWSRSRHDGQDDRDSFVGVSAEVIYRLLDARKDPIGLALYFEPSWNAKERELEAKLLLQKNFLNNTLRFAFNINVEDAWDRDEGHWNEGSMLEFRAGLAYVLSPQWCLGAELSNEHEFEGLIFGGSSREKTSAYFAGPTLQFASELITVTLSAQAQLPWADSPSHVSNALEHGFVAGAERYRVLLRIGTEM